MYCTYVSIVTVNMQRQSENIPKSTVLLQADPAVPSFVGCQQSVLPSLCAVPPQLTSCPLSAVLLQGSTVFLLLGDELPQRTLSPPLTEGQIFSAAPAQLVPAMLSPGNQQNFVLLEISSL